MTEVETFKASQEVRDVPLWFGFEMYKFEFLCLYFHSTAAWNNGIHIWAALLFGHVLNLKKNFIRIRRVQRNLKWIVPPKNDWTWTDSYEISRKWTQSQTRGQSFKLNHVIYVISRRDSIKSVINEIYTFCKSDFSGIFLIRKTSLNTATDSFQWLTPNSQLYLIT